MFSLRPLVAASLLLVSAAASFADDKVVADWTTTGNASLVSDYLPRGVSQTQHQPTWQATIEAAHKAGWYVGSFGSGVSHAAYPNGGGAEIDLWAGRRWTVGEGQFDLGAYTYWFPGSTSTGPDGKTVSFSTQEIKLGYNWGAFNVAAWVSPTTTWFGFAYDPRTGEQRNTRGSTYLEANWSTDVAENLSLALHVGTERLRGISEYNFVEERIGLNWTQGRWVFGAAISHNDGKSYLSDGTPLWIFSDANGRGRKVTGTFGLVSAAYSF